MNDLPRIVRSRRIMALTLPFIAWSYLPLMLLQAPVERAIGGGSWQLLSGAIWITLFSAGYLCASPIARESIRRSASNGRVNESGLHLASGWKALFGIVQTDDQLMIAMLAGPFISGVVALAIASGLALAGVQIPISLSLGILAGFVIFGFIMSFASSRQASRIVAR